MNKKIKATDLPTFDPAEHLKNDAEIAAYLSLVIDEDDPVELAHALGIVARVRGMAQIAEETGIGSEALYKALRAHSQPRFNTFSRICKSLGVKLVAQHKIDYMMSKWLFDDCRLSPDDIEAKYFYFLKHLPD